MRSSLRLVWALDVRHLVAHRTRLALSALGIAVGVALAVAVGALGSSVQASLEAIGQASASEANLEVRPPGTTGLDPAVLARVRAVEGVEAAGATVESYVQLRSDQRAVRVLALGVDSGILEMSPRAADPGTLRTADPFGLVLSGSVARDLGVRPGDSIEITTPDGWRRVPVGVVLPPDATERTRVVVSTVGVMQPLLGRGTRFDAVYVKADDPEVALAHVQEAVGDDGRVGPIAFRATQVQQLLAGATAAFSVGTIVALFVGAFLVYNTMAMAAVERVREAALLRAVGAKRRQVFGLFLAEGGVLGVVGSLIGCGAGVLLARLLLVQQGSTLQEIYPIQITVLDVEPRLLAAAAVAGVVAALVAAFLPARRAARTDVAPALGPAGTFEDPTRGPRKATAVVAIACGLVGPAVAIQGVRSGVEASGLTLLGFALTLAAIALLIPTGVPAVARVLLGAVARRRRTPSIVRLASGEVLRSPGRTAFTVGAVLLSLGLVVGFSIAQSSFQRAFDVAFEDIIAADLYVRTPTWRIFGSDVPLDERLADEIEEIGGVEAAWPFRLLPATLDERPLLILAYDAEKYAEHSLLSGAARAERLAEARALRAPNAVLASPSLLSQLGYELGDEIALPTPTGIHRLTLAGTLDDPSAINPEIVFDFAAFRRIWGSGGADNFGVVAASRDGIDEVQSAIASTLGPRYSITVDTAEQYRKVLSESVGSINQLVASVQLVAVIVAALGLANTLLISTFERRRDLGVLRAVGLLRRQLRRMVAAEALLIGGLGVLLAWVLGTLIGFGMYTFIRTQLGLSFPIVWPVSGYAGAAVLGLATAVAASLYPAQRAARVDVVDALAYE